MAAPLPENEAARLATLALFRLGGERIAGLDRVANLAADVFGVPIALVSIVTATEQRFQGACGLDVPGTSRDFAFCAHTILGEDLLIVPDATRDPRFADNPLVTGPPGIRFYAGVPLFLEGGEGAVGSLCLIDVVPRELGAAECQRLRSMAAIVVDLLELRRGSLIAQASEHRATEAERRAERDASLLRATLESIEHGLAAFDADDRLLVWNERFCHVLALPEPVCRPGAPFSAFTLLATATAQSADPDHRFDSTLPDGRCLEIARHPMPDGGFVVVCADVTHRRQLDRLKNEFVSTVSHELRTPLTAITGSLKLLSSAAAGPLPARATRLLEIASKNCERLAALIEQLLTIGRGDWAGPTSGAAWIDVGDLLQQALAAIAPTAALSRIPVTLAEPVPKVAVQGDQSQLQQALGNLLSNAVKFSGPGQSVQVSAGTTAAGMIRIAVSDQGSGIPEAFRARVFDRFAQADGSDQRQHDGTGLGLYIARAIVERHGGTIGFTSTSGAGSTFHIELPAAPAP